MSISVQNLACSRGGRRIFEGVNFSLTKGDCLIIRGDNGCGKTTLLRCLAGLNNPDEGTIDINHDDLIYAGHQDALKAQLSVAENLQFWAGIYGVTDITPTLDLLKLTDLSHRLAHTLSAGQKRRLGLARLALTKKPIWILDEPTVSLDAENTVRFATLLKDHCTNGGIAILSTHIDLDVPATQFDLGQYKATTHADPFL